MTWNGVRAGGFLTLSDPLLVLAAAAAAPSMFAASGRRTALPPAWILVPAGAFTAIGLVSVVFLGDSPASLAGLLRLVAAMTLVPFAVGVVGGQLGAVVLLVDLWVASAAVNSGVAISDYAFGTTFGETITGVASLGRSTGLTTHSNHLAFVMVFSIPLAIGRLATARGRPARLFFAIATGAVLMAVMTSGSRGGLVGAAIAIAITPFLMPAELRRRTLAWIAIAGSVALLVGTVTFRDEALVALDRLIGSSTETASAVSESDQERARLRHEAIENFTRNPIFGSGIAHSRSAHNVYLQLLASTGMLGTLAFIAYLLGCYWLSRRVTRQRDLPVSVRAIAATAGASAVTWALLGMVENQFADRYLFVPGGLVVACAWFAAAFSTPPRSAREAGPNLCTGNFLDRLPPAPATGGLNRSPRPSHHA